MTVFISPIRQKDWRIFPSSFQVIMWSCNEPFTFGCYPWLFSHHHM